MRTMVTDCPNKNCMTCYPSAERMTAYWERLEKASDLAEMVLIGDDLARDKELLEWGHYRAIALFFDVKFWRLECTPSGGRR